MGVVSCSTLAVKQLTRLAGLTTTRPRDPLEILLESDLDACGTPVSSSVTSRPPRTPWFRARRGPIRQTAIEVLRTAVEPGAVVQVIE